MIEYKQNPGIEFFDDSNNSVNPIHDGKLSLTKLWEIIVRTKRLPDGFDEQILYNGVRDRLRDAEREVRQHALRVLSDLIPVTQPLGLDDHMHFLVPELLINLGHPAPALRKSSLDTLRIYLKHSNNCDKILKDIISSNPDEPTILAAAPFLINPKKTSDSTLRYIVDQLWKWMTSPGANQEVAVRSLSKMRSSLGEERFGKLVEPERLKELLVMYDQYGLPKEQKLHQNDVNCDRKVWSSDGDGFLEDKVILETEITLRTGPAITMKIHEETRTDCKDSGGRHGMGVVRVLTEDSETDYFESARRTPRKVRFGGEIVKMRTPESDSNNESVDDATVHITVTDAVSIKTHRSLIPVRITSLPSTPKKKIQNSKRLSKSTPNLTNSRIPLRKKGTKKNKDLPKKLPKLSVSSSEEREKSLSPIPVHKGIEVFHNLTRSPERLKNSPEPPPSFSPLPDINGGKIRPVAEQRSPEFVPLSLEETLPRSRKNSQSSASSGKGKRKASPKPGNGIDGQLSTSDKEKERSEIGTLERPSSRLNSLERPNKIEIDGKQQQIVSEEHSSRLNSSNRRNQIYSNAIDSKTENREQNIDSKTIIRPRTSSRPRSASESRPESSKKPELHSEPSLRHDSAKHKQNRRCESDSNLSKRFHHHQQQRHPTPIPTAFNSFQVYQEDPNNNTNKIPETTNHSQVLTTINNNREDLWAKSEALDTLHKVLKDPSVCETLEPGPAALFFEALFSCHHKDRLHSMADEALGVLVNTLRPSVLEQCLRRITLGFCRMGAPTGVRLSLIVMRRCSAKKLQNEIIEEAFGHRTREGALQILMASARLLPSSEIEMLKIAEFASNALRDRRRRIRHAALELLATLAQIGSISDVIDVVRDVIGSPNDNEHLLQVVRTRLSRRQLPSVEMDGTIRYSSPRDQTELEWLSGPTTGQRFSASSSSSSTTTNATITTNPVNYWKHNSRHENVLGNEILPQPPQRFIDETNNNGQSPIWAVDSSFFSSKTSRKGNHGKGVNLRPVYILQPEGVTIAPQHEFRGGHRRYDRGRSFSPHRRRHFQEGSIHSDGTVAPQQTGQPTNGQRFTYSDSFRKSFSSEQLYSNNQSDKHHHEPYSFSSRSSTTSNGSSTKSGVWHREFRSGIPIPISHDTKLRLRTTNNNAHVNVGPVIARRTTITPRESPVQISSPQIPEAGGGRIEEDDDVVPPRSSGSESSGYFTPPPEAQQAFVKLDTEESDEIINIIQEDVVDSISNKENGFLSNSHLQSNFSVSSAETSDAPEVDDTPIKHSHDADDEDDQPQPPTPTNSFPLTPISPHQKQTPIAASLDDLDFLENLPSPRKDNINKSKSVTDLKNFLPEIQSSPRKNVNSAPPLEIVISDKILLPGSAVEVIEKTATTVVTQNSSRLSRRFGRTLSKKSVRNVTRSDSVSDLSKPLCKPKEGLMQALHQLESNEWEITVQGLQNLTKVIKHHPEIVESNMHAVCVGLAKHVRNLRSQVARTACVTASELFSRCKRGLDMEVEEVAAPLLQRTADTNRFLRADANSALDVMCNQLSASRIVTVITGRGCCHPNAVVRATAARLLNNLVTKFGADRIFLMPKDIRDRIFLAGANSLTDGSLDARKQAKSMLSVLVGHHHFQRVLIEAVPQHLLRHIAKTLNSLKSSTST